MDEDFFEGEAGVEGEAQDVGDDFSFGEAFFFGGVLGFFGVDAVGSDDGSEHVGLVLAVHDGEAGAVSGCLGDAAEHAVADGGEGAAPEAGGAVGEEGVHAFEHFAGGFVGEGEEEDVGGGDAVFEEVGDAVGEGAGFAAACACDDEGGTGRGLHGGELLGVEFRSVVDPDGGRMAVKGVGAGHGRGYFSGKWARGQAGR